MKQITTFLRSKKLWIIVVLSAISLILLEPGRYTHPRVSQVDYKVEVFGISDSNGGHFSLDSNETRFDIVPGDSESIVATWTFLEPKNIELKVGVSNWAVQDEEGSAEVVFGVRHNQLVLLNDLKTQPGNSRKLILEIDSGDVVSVEVNKGAILLEDIGYVEIKEHRPYDSLLVVFYVILFWIVFVWFVFNGFWLASIPMIIGSLLIWYSIFAYDMLFNASQLLWSILFFSLSASLFSIVVYPSNKWIRFGLKTLFITLSFLACTLPFVVVLYTLEFGKPLEQTDYFGFYQTDIRESISYLQFNSPKAWWLILLALPILFIPLAFIKKRINKLNPATFLVSAILVIMTFIFEIPEMITVASDSYGDYTKELELFKENLRSFDEFEGQLQVSQKKDNEVYFIIIGEAQSKFHMSQYGYVRPTTPHLDSLSKLANTVIFSNAISSNTHTAMSLSAAFTQANYSNQLDFQKSPSIINILNAADVHTYWISNQLKYGIWDNAVSAIAEQCEEQVFINSNMGKTNETDDFDGALLEVIKRKLKSANEGTHVVFIHLMGSHGQYNKRYPDEFRMFDHDDFKSLFGNLNPYEVNPYDNSMIYNDFVVSEMVHLLDSLPFERKAMFYFADHAEDLITKHGHSSSLFNFRMIHIPTYFWFSDGYIETYSSQIANLKENSTKTFTNDLVYDAILGLTGISTKASNSEGFNVFSAGYQLQDSSIKILNHIDYTDPGHSVYHEEINLQKLSNDSLIPFNIFPHRVDSKGMLYEMTAKGFDGIECDLVFNDTVFEIGHGGEEYMSGNSLEDYLNSSVGDSLTFIWLDIKNLRNDNIDKVLERLIVLDDQYKIKQRVFVESDTKSLLFDKIRKAGFNTSYYLPTDISQIEDRAILKSKAIEVANQINKQGVSSISFDASLYNWVTVYLSPIIPQELEWHTWQLGLELQQTNFIENLHKQPFASDNRIKTLLIRVHSPYYL